MRQFFPHVTVASVVECNGRFLLVQENTKVGIRWNQPAGHLEPKESPLEGAIRETLEETGYSIVPSHFLGVYFTSGPEDTVYLRLAFIANQAHVVEGFKLDPDIIQAKWLTIDEIYQLKEQHRSDLVLKCIEDYLKGKRYDLECIFYPSQQ